jgi:zinc protease
VAYATSIVLQELKKMTEGPPTETELNTSKRGFIDRFPHSFATKGQIANSFAQDEFTGRYARDPDYWQKFRARIEAVTAGEVERVAKKYLTPDKAVVLVVGHKDDVLMKLPDHPVELKELTSGPVTELPLRDPLTMKPMASAEKPAK